MKIDRPFSRLWYVHNSDSFDTIFTSRDEARDRKRDLQRQGATSVTISYLPVTLGSGLVRDLKS